MGKEKEINSKANEFIDHDALKEQEMHPEAHQYIDDTQANTVKKYLATPQPSELESTLGGAEQGLTLSHAPQISGAIGAALEKTMGNPDKKSLADLYNEYKMASQNKLNAQAQANPGSFAAGSIGGGVLGLMGAGMAGKAAGLVAPAVEGAAAPTMAARIRQGAGLGAGLGAVNAQGQSQAPLLSGQMAGDIYKGAEEGALTGAALTPPMAAATAGVGAAGRGLSKLGKASWLGDTPSAFMAGFGPNGQASQQWLLGPEAARKVSQGISNISTEIPQTIEQTLEGAAKAKQGIINSAAEKGVRVSPDKIDAFVTQYTGETPNHIDPAVNSELQRLQTMIKNAKSGREVEKVTRHFFAEGNTERGQFANLFQQKQLEEQAKTASDVPAPQTEKEAFEDVLRQKQAEQKALPGAQDSAPYEIHYEPIPGNTKQVLGVIRQRVIQENPDAFTGFKQAAEGEQPEDLGQTVSDMQPDLSQPIYRKVASRVITPDAPAQELPKLQMEFAEMPDQPGRSLGIIKQAVLDDQGNVTGYKIVAKKVLNNEEMASWRDMTEVVRANDKDLTDPRQLLDLYKTLKNRTQFGEKSFQTPEAKAQATSAVQDIQQMLKGNEEQPGAIPELQGVDQDIHNLNKAQEAVGLDKDMADPNRNKLIAGLVEKSIGTNVSAVEAQNQLNKMVDALKQVDPEYSDQIAQQIKTMQNQIKVTNAVQEKAYYPRPLSTPSAFFNKSANALGYSIGSITPDTMRSMAQVLGRTANSKAASDLANVLLQASGKDERTRNSLMFGLMQNPGYRQMLEPMVDKGESTKSSESKDKTLQKYK